MTELRKEFKKHHPETIGEKDKAFDDSNYIDWLEEKLKDARNKAENLPISGVTPRFCFICGSGLKDAGHDWLQCESEECAEMFRTSKDAKGNQHVMMFRTPFTPK